MIAGSFEQDKSKLDWEKFKEKEGIREELENHNKGKDGYVYQELVLFGCFCLFNLAC